MLSLRPPPVAVALDHGEPDTQTVYLDLKLASIHGQLNALVLCLCELGPKLGIIGRQGQQEQGVGNGWPPRDRAGRGRRR